MLPIEKYSGKCRSTHSLESERRGENLKIVASGRLLLRRCMNPEDKGACSSLFAEAQLRKWWALLSKKTEIVQKSRGRIGAEILADESCGGSARSVQSQ